MQCSHTCTSILCVLFAASSTSALKIAATPKGSVLETDKMQLQSLREFQNFTEAVLVMVLPPKDIDLDSKTYMQLLMKNTELLEKEAAMMHAAIKQSQALEAKYTREHTSAVCGATGSKVAAPDHGTCMACVKSKCAMPSWYVILGPLYEEEHCQQLYAESCNECGRGGMHCWGNDKETLQLAQKGPVPLSPAQVMQDYQQLFLASTGAPPEIGDPCQLCNGVLESSGKEKMRPYTVCVLVCFTFSHVSNQPSPLLSQPFGQYYDVYGWHGMKQGVLSMNQASFFRRVVNMWRNVEENSEKISQIQTMLQI